MPKQATWATCLRTANSALKFPIVIGGKTMISSAGSNHVGRETYSAPRENQAQLERIAKAKLYAMQADNVDTVTAIDEVVQDMNLSETDGAGMIIDLAV